MLGGCKLNTGWAINIPTQDREKRIIESDGIMLHFKQEKFPDKKLAPAFD